MDYFYDWRSSTHLQDYNQPLKYNGTQQLLQNGSLDYLRQANNYNYPQADTYYGWNNYQNTTQYANTQMPALTSIGTNMQASSTPVPMQTMQISTPVNKIGMPVVSATSTPLPFQMQQPILDQVMHQIQHQQPQQQWTTTVQAKNYYDPYLYTNKTSPQNSPPKYQDPLYYNPNDYRYQTRPQQLPTTTAAVGNTNSSQKDLTNIYDKHNKSHAAHTHVQQHQTYHQNYHQGATNGNYTYQNEPIYSTNYGVNNQQNYYQMPTQTKKPTKTSAQSGKANTSAAVQRQVASSENVLDVNNKKSIPVTKADKSSKEQKKVKDLPLARSAPAYEQRTMTIAPPTKTRNEGQLAHSKSQKNLSNSTYSSQSTIGKAITYNANHRKSDPDGLRKNEYGSTDSAPQRSNNTQNIYSNYAVKKPPGVYSRYYQSGGYPHLNGQNKMYPTHMATSAAIENPPVEKHVTMRDQHTKTLKPETSVTTRDAKKSSKEKERSKEKDRAKRAEVKSNPVFIPPNTEELMRPTLRGAPAGLFQNLSDLSLKYVNTDLVKNEMPAQKSISGLMINKNGLNDLKTEVGALERQINEIQNAINNSKEKQKQTILERSKAKVKEQKVKQVQQSKSESEKVNIRPATSAKVNYEQSDEKPMSPDLESFKVQSEKAFYNDNHFSIQSRTGKLIIREKKAPKTTNNNVAFNNNINNSNNKVSNTNTTNQQQSKPLTALSRSSTNSTYKINDGVNKSPEIKCPANDQIKKLETKNQNVSSPQLLRLGQTPVLDPTQVQNAANYLKQLAEKPGRGITRIENTDTKNVKLRDAKTKTEHTKKQRESIADPYDPKKVFGPSDRTIKTEFKKDDNDNSSPLFGITAQDNKTNKKRQEKTLSAIGSILDVPLPSDNDAFSEYSTFVNNIFSKALEK